jgi:hypothetical protein
MENKSIYYTVPFLSALIYVTIKHFIFSGEEKVKFESVVFEFIAICVLMGVNLAVFNYVSSENIFIQAEVIKTGSPTFPKF